MKAPLSPVPKCATKPIRYVGKPSKELKHYGLTEAWFVGSYDASDFKSKAL